MSLLSPLPLRADQMRGGRFKSLNSFAQFSSSHLMQSLCGSRPRPCRDLWLQPRNQTI